MRFLLILTIIVCYTSELNAANNANVTVDGATKSTRLAGRYQCANCWIFNGVDNCCAGVTDRVTGSYEGTRYETCAGCNMSPTGSYVCTLCVLDDCLATVYRFAGSGTGDHFYSFTRALPIISPGPAYIAETPLGKAYPHGITYYAEFSVQLMAYTIRFNGATNHFYTTDPMEGDQMMQQGWTPIGVLCPLWSYQVLGTLPVVRFAHPGSFIYLLTTNENDIGTTGYWTERRVVGYIDQV